jgi:DNA-directed RNA polymerase specialized sigma24 family protein
LTQEAAVDPALIAPSPADPAAAALAGERAEALRAAVRGLADPYRETVVLRFFDLHRGLLMLRRTLIDEVGGP